MILSHTQLSMFLNCPRQWYYRYVMKMKGSATSAMVLGRVWHEAIEFYYAHKMNEGSLPPYKDVLEFYSNAFTKSFQQKVVLAPTETLTQLHDIGQRALRLHFDAVGPKVNPEAIEQRHTIDVPGYDNLKLIVVFDVVADGWIRDNKLKSSVPAQKEVNAPLGGKTIFNNGKQAGFGEGFQLSLYSYTYRILTGETEAGLALDVVHKKKTAKGIVLEFQERKTSRTEKDLWFVEELLTATALDIETALSLAKEGQHEEAFKPNPNYCWCDPRWCSYYNICQGCDEEEIPF